MFQVLFGLDDDYVASIASAVIAWSIFCGWIGYRINRWRARSSPRA